MHPESWRQIRRLLLLSYAVEPEELIQLRPAVMALDQALPAANITLLMPEPDRAIAADLPRLNVRFLDGYSRDPVWSPATRLLIGTLQQQAFEAAIIFTGSGRSPYALAYLCYLAGIPIRVGQSSEFGGGVLSSSIAPPIETVSPSDYHLHLLQSIGIIPELAITSTTSLSATIQ
jgi:ADP-heptose:LPS heptosyltransferase